MQTRDSLYGCSTVLQAFQTVLGQEIICSSLYGRLLKVGACVNTIIMQHQFICCIGGHCVTVYNGNNETRIVCNLTDRPVAQLRLTRAFKLSLIRGFRGQATVLTNLPLLSLSGERTCRFSLFIDPDVVDTCPTTLLMRPIFQYTDDLRSRSMNSISWCDIRFIPLSSYRLVHAPL
jgi:hypothetical protein